MNRLGVGGWVFIQNFAGVKTQPGTVPESLYSVKQMVHRVGKNRQITLKIHAGTLGATEGKVVRSGSTGTSDCGLTVQALGSQDLGKPLPLTS